MRVSSKVVAQFQKPLVKCSPINFAMNMLTIAHKCCYSNLPQFNRSNHPSIQRSNIEQTVSFNLFFVGVCFFCCDLNNFELSDKSKVLIQNTYQNANDSIPIKSSIYLFIVYVRSFSCLSDCCCRFPLSRNGFRNQQVELKTHT